MIAIPSAPIWQSPEPCPQPAPDKVTFSAQPCELEFALITKAELNKNSGCKVFLISYSESTKALCFFWSFFPFIVKLIILPDKPLFIGIKDSIESKDSFNFLLIIFVSCSFE